MNSYFRWVIFIAWWSLILFLVDYANRTGKWWFHFVAMAVFVFTCIGAWYDILKKHSPSKGLAN